MMVIRRLYPRLWRRNFRTLRRCIYQMELLEGMGVKERVAFALYIFHEA